MSRLLQRLRETFGDELLIRTVNGYELTARARQLQDELQSLTEYWRFVLGAILAIIVIGFPGGIAGFASDLRRRLARSAA